MTAHAVLRRGLGAAALIAAASGFLLPAQAETTTVQTASDLKRFNVTVRRFDPAHGPAAGTDFILPVDSPDEEHAVSAAMSNAVAFTPKVAGGRVLPVAFTCVAVAPR